MSHRTYEPDPDLVNRIAVDLLARQAREISTTRAAAELLQDYPELTHLGLGDSEFDDLRDALWRACARTVITIPAADAA
jgi:hypothetical protein